MAWVRVKVRLNFRNRVTMQPEFAPRLVEFFEYKQCSPASAEAQNAMQNAFVCGF